ncbi:MAG: DUF1385 domain-containing protein [Chloroflexi bacterium]|nr:DUF1385 domain-containing protein [Chloroflexota bacterium]
MSKPTYGGQAVIEGVMMRGQFDMAVAVREPSGNILIHSERLTGALYASKWAKRPFIRGVLLLWDTMVLGVRTLLFSAKIAAAEEAVEMTPRVMWGTLAISLAMALSLFFVLPVLLVGIVDQYITSSVVSNVVEKAIRLGMLVGYIGAVGFIPDVRRVFAYHGAEHKAVNAHEDGAPLVVDVVEKYSTAHPRCGTSFLLVVMLVSFVAFVALGRPPFEIRVISRIVLVPVIAAVAYELIKLGALHHRNLFVKMLLAPGLALQSLTTRQPTPDQVEVAIAALKHVVAAEQERVSQIGTVPAVSAVRP